MKFLQAKDLPKGTPTNEDGDPENKMQPGSRSDERPEPTKEITDLAKSLNVDLSTVRGSGKGRAITEQDVRRAAEGRTNPPISSPRARE